MFFDDHHTSENLCNFLKNVFTKWKIENKVVSIVTDNAANIVSAVRYGGWQHFPCFAHTINLIVHNGLKTIKETVDKIKRVVEFFKRSSQALVKLRNIQKQMGLPHLKLKQDVPTRWNSTFDMLTRIHKIKGAVVSTLTLLSQDNTLTHRDWLIVEKASAVLSVFNDVTLEIGTEKSVSISKVMLFVKAMKKHIGSVLLENDTLPPEISQMVHVLTDQISLRFRNIEDNELTTQATLLDARFKKFGFSDVEKYEKSVNVLKNEASTVDTRSDSSLPPNQDINKPRKKDTQQFSDLWEDFDEEVLRCQALSDPTSAGVIEVQQYLQEPLISRLENPLEWWDSRKHVYPRLYKIMLKHLCTVATSVPCERIFSKAGQFLTERRNKLSSSKITQILFLNHNL